MTAHVPADGGTTEPPGAAADGVAVGAEAKLAIDGETLMLAPVAIYGVDLYGRICFWNAAAESLFGWTADEILGQIVPFMPEEGIAGSLDGMGDLLAGSTFSEVEFTALHHDGHPLTLVTSASVLEGEDGVPVAILAFARDASEQAATIDALEAAEHKWHELARHSADAIAIVDAEGVVTESIITGDDVLGYPAGWWTGRDATEVMHPDDHPRVADAWAALAAAPGNTMRDTFRARHRDGHYEQVELTGANLLDDPLIEGIVVTNRRVSPARQSEALLADEARIFAMIARDEPLADVFAGIVAMIDYHTGGSSAVFLLDPAGSGVRVAVPGSVPSDVLDDICGHVQVMREEGVEPDQQLLVMEDFAQHPITAANATALAELGYRSGWGLPLLDYRTQTISGFIAVLVADARLPTAHERNLADLADHLGAIAIGRDRWQRELRVQALYDPLTSLPNRSLIFQTLDAAIARSQTTRTSVTVMVLDLDRFGYINDSLGHAVGDILINEVADRLRSVLRPTDLLGRMSADEFVVIFGDDAGIPEAVVVASRVRQVMGDAFHLDGNDVFLSASIGIATTSTGRDDADTVLRHADAAMFRAKELGRDRFVVYDEGQRSRALDRLALDRDLRLVLDRDQLVLHFQPEVDCTTGAIVGAEALVRWEHPERGLIAPDGFIALAEETGMIVPIGHWVLDEAVRQARAWTDAYPEHEGFAVSVNLSARQLINRSLVDTVAFVLTRYDWAPSHLTLELTESILIEDRDATLYVLNRLRMLGVHLAIDDFGTGFASLDYLRRLSVDSVKIDRSFITPLDDHGLQSPVATAMVHMAKAFDLRVTAEGVENDRQLAGVRALGCDSAQGYLFSRPLPAEDFEQLLSSTPRW